MVGRPPCLWTCLSRLVKPVDLNNIKNAIYIKAWKEKNKQKKHAHAQTSCHWNNQIASHLPKSPFTRREERHQCSWMVVRSRCRLHPGTYFFSLCEGVLFACLGCERRTLAVSKFLPEKRRSKTNRASLHSGRSWTAEPQSGLWFTT